MEDDSLLDVFVNIKPRPDWEKGFEDAVTKTKAMFANLESESLKQASAAQARANAMSKASQAGGRNVKRDADESAKTYANSLREAVDRFIRERHLVNIEVALTGDEDAKRQIRQIQDQFGVYLKDFKLAEKGEGGDEAREAAIEGINKLREDGLRIINETNRELIRQKGLDVYGDIDSTKSERLRSISNEAEVLRRKITEVRQEVAKAGDISLSTNFNELNNQLAKMLTQLRQSVKVGTLVDAEATIAALRSADDELQRFKAEARKEIKLNLNVDDLRTQFAISSRQVSVEMEKLKTPARRANTEEIRSEVERLKKEIKEAEVLFKNAFDSSDTSGLDAALTKMNALKGAVLEVQKQATAAVDLRRIAESIVASEQQARSEDRIDIALNRANLKGLSNPQRNQLMNMDAEIHLAEKAFDSLAKKIDGTEHNVLELARAFVALRTEGDHVGTVLQQMGIDGQRLDAVMEMLEKSNFQTGLAQQLKLAQNEMRSAGGSMNALSNNAYQLGQAFEDAAVGYELNGVAGAVRGASNNVSFLINDLSRVPVIQTAIANGFISMRRNLNPEQAAAYAANIGKMIPLIAGIGAGLAIVVLPKMVEWLESLNDVDLKMEDISERINRDFKEIDFAISLREDRESFLQAAKDASSVRDVLREMQQMLEGAGTQQRRIFETLNVADQMGTIEAMLTQMRNLRQVIFEQRRQAEDALRNAQSTINDTGVFDDPGSVMSDIVRRRISKQVAETKSLVVNEMKDLFDQITTIESQAQIAILDAKQGVPLDVAGLKSALDAIADLKKKSEQFQKEGTLDLVDNEVLAKGMNSLQAIGTELEKIYFAQKKINDQFANNLPAGLQALVDKSRDLAFTLEIARKKATGQATEDEVFLANLQRENDLYRELIDANLQLAYEENNRQNGGNEAARRVKQQKIDAVNRELTIHQLQLEELEILNRIADAEERRADAKKSQFTDFERYARALQENELSSDSKTDAEQRNLPALRQFLDANRRRQDQILSNISRMSDEMQQSRRMTEQVLQAIVRGKWEGMTDAQREWMFGVRDLADKRVEMFDRVFDRGINRFVEAQKETTRAIKEQPRPAGATAQ